MWNPDQEKEDDGGNCKTTHLPTSPRNRLIYFTGNECPNKVRSIIDHLLKVDQRVNEPVGMDASSAEQPPAKKAKRTYKARVLAASPQEVSQQLGVEFPVAQNRASGHRTLFTRFSEDLTTIGYIQWVSTSPTRNLIVMNDYCPTTGDLLPQKFVLLDTEEGDLNLGAKCSCTNYKQLETCVGVELQLDEEVFLAINPGNNRSTSCMHCRYYGQYLKGTLDQINIDSSNLSHVQQKVYDSISTMGDPVLILGGLNPHSTTKLCVEGAEEEDDYAMVNVTWTGQGYMSRCLEGLCQATLINSKKLPRKAKPLGPNFCSHLRTLHSNLDVLGDMLSTALEGPDEGEEDENGELFPPASNLQDQDEGLRDLPVDVHFDVQKGMWLSQSRSQHKPCGPSDELLITSAMTRHQYVRRDNFQSDGCYPGPDLKPNLKETCPCGAPFGDLQVDIRPKIFTRNVRMHSGSY
jgi:hypothetical protein